jgi:predicted dehydrogenase
MKRRRFLRDISIAAAGTSILPLISTCRNSDNLIHIGMIGTGSHGVERNLKHYLKYPELCRVVAVCDVSMSRATSAKNLVNNTYKNKDCKVFQDFRELLEQRSIDAVQISTPDHWHVPISIMAALKRKHICCEKPTLTIAEGRLLCNVLNKTGVVYQLSIEDRFLPVYHKMGEVVLNGRIGELKNIQISLPIPQMPTQNLEITNPPDDLDYDLWLGPVPEIPFISARTFFNFRWHDAFAGGILTDWGTHYCDTAQLVSGSDSTGPVSIMPIGETLYYDDGIFNTAYQFELLYRYQNGTTMTVQSGPGSDASIRCEGDKGWIASVGWNNELSASEEKITDLSQKQVNLPTGDDEFRDFLEKIRSGDKVVNTPEAGHRTSSLLHTGNIALKLNRKLDWDPVHERFVHDPEADRFLKREMRGKWNYDKICPGYEY